MNIGPGDGHRGRKTDATPWWIMGRLDSRHAPQFETVLVPVDFSRGSLDALGTACERFSAPNATLILLNAFEPSDATPMRAALFGHASGEGERELLRNIQQQLQALADQLREKWREVCVTVKEGKPVDLIIAEAAERHADLVVMGAHGNHHLSRRLFGDTTYQVARRVPCSVMVFREQDARIASVESPD